MISVQPSSTQIMAACGSLQHIFENSLPPKSPSLLESLPPWNHPMKTTIDDESFPCTELFGELHFKENNHVESSSSFPLPLSPPSSSLWRSSSFLGTNSQSCIQIQSSSADCQSCHTDMPIQIQMSTSHHGDGEATRHNDGDLWTNQTRQHRDSDSFSSRNSESLSLCTEGLGFESCDDVEDLKNDNNNNNNSFDWKQRDEKRSVSRHRSSRVCRGSFPPPISSIGRDGKPWVCFKSFREDGRFILKEIRPPIQEFLHSCREDGRLTMQFISSDDEIFEEDEEEEEEEDEGKIKDVVDDNRHEKNSDKLE